MEKVKYLAKKLKAFTFEDIFLLAELSKEDLEKYLENLIKEKIIKQTAQGYVCITYDEKVLNKIKAKQKKKPVVTTMEFDPNKSELLQSILKADLPRVMSAEEKRIWKQAPPEKKAVVRKYMHMIKITQGLYGKDLSDFLEIYGTLHPEYAISLSTLSRKRKVYKLKGKVGLLFGDIEKRIQKRKIKDECYELFKKLYLNKLKYPAEKCIEEIAKYYKLELKEVPCIRTFRRKLRLEFTKDEVKRLRS